MNKLSAKNKLRQDIVARKNEYTLEELLAMSDEVFSVLEITGDFQSAKNIFIYNNLKDEVSTQSFIERWYKKKQFYLPVVVKDKLVFRAYNKDGEYSVSGLGIFEPKGEDYTNYPEVDMVIVPGMAFDRKMNRLGRGKGYYDRFLPQVHRAKKVGVCFDFQLYESIPNDSTDVKMDILVSENDLIW